MDSDGAVIVGVAVLLTVASLVGLFCVVFEELDNENPDDPQGDDL